MKRFDSFEIDFNRSGVELREFGNLLDHAGSGPLKGRKHILAFFQEHRHISALIGYVYTACPRIDRIAYEFDFFGDYAADLAVGDSRKGTYTFVEFEDATPTSIFKKAGKKHSLEWAPRFEKGYSQIIDWFWKLDDLKRTGSLRDRFDGAELIDYRGLLVIGRSRDLDQLQRERLDWRRGKVVIDSKHVDCVTFDELRADLEEKLRIFGLAASNAQRVTSRQSRRPPRLKKRPKPPRRSEGQED